MKKVIVFTPERITSEINDSLAASGYEVCVFSDIERCIQAVYGWDCAALFIDACDQESKQGACLSYCLAIKNINPQFPIILLIHKGDILLTVRAAKIGIEYIFEKPLKKNDLSYVFNKILLKEQQLPLNLRLTEKEKQILQSILMGRTNKEIADEFGRSTRTIEEHRANIMEKVGADNTVDLLTLSLQAGLIDPIAPL